MMTQREKDDFSRCGDLSDLLSDELNHGKARIYADKTMAEGVLIRVHP